jgi:hypothetical protein
MLYHLNKAAVNFSRQMAYKTRKSSASKWQKKHQKLQEANSALRGQVLALTELLYRFAPTHPEVARDVLLILNEGPAMDLVRAAGTFVPLPSPNLHQKDVHMVSSNALVEDPVVEWENDPVEEDILHPPVCSPTKEFCLPAVTSVPLPSPNLHQEDVFMVPSNALLEDPVVVWESDPDQEVDVLHSPACPSIQEHLIHFSFFYPPVCMPHVVALVPDPVHPIPLLPVASSPPRTRFGDFHSDPWDYLEPVVLVRPEKQPKPDHHRRTLCIVAANYGADFYHPGLCIVKGLRTSGPYQNKMNCTNSYENAKKKKKKRRRQL